MPSKRTRTLFEAKCKALDNAWAASRRGGDYYIHLRQLALLELQLIADARVEIGETGEGYVRIMANGPGGRSCAACQVQDSRILRLDRELLRPTIPIHGCTCTGYEDHQISFCLCMYLIVFDDELAPAASVPAP